MQRHVHIVTGLDIGTSKIALCVGTLQDGVPTILGLGKSPSAGFQRGVISNIEEAISALSAAIASTERLCGFNLTSAIVGIEGTYVTTTTSKGVVAVTGPNSEIRPEDIGRVIEAARAVALPPNQEILHVLPKLYSIDGLEGVKDPLGMTGIRLEVDTFIIGASTTAIRNLSRVATSAGLQIEDMVFSPLATANALIDKTQRESGVALVDIGSTTTALVVFEEGDVIHTAVLPVGSSHITNDIAIGLRTRLEIAEAIKQEHAYALAREISEDDIIELGHYDPDEETTSHRRYICEIVEARLGELFAMLRDELRLIGKDGILPAGIVFTGGGARLAGLTTVAKEQLQLPAVLGVPVAPISGMIDKLDDPLYATSVGLMLHGLAQTREASWGGGALGPHESIVNSLVERVKIFLKNLLP